MKINIDKMKLYNMYKLYDENGNQVYSKTYARRWIIDNHYEDLSFGIEYYWNIGGAK